MCGRYTLRRYDLLSLGLRAEPSAPFEEFDERPHYNVAPSQFMPIAVAKEGHRQMRMAQWGFVPSWTKGPPKSRPINARAETIATSAMFRQAFAKRRCLVPADGFYEWQGTKPPKQPYFIHRKDDGLIAFAGLWERWRPSPDAESVETYTIITTAPNDAMRPIHNRMPAILRPQDYDTWLDPEAPAQTVHDLLRPSDEPLEAVPIATRVNNVRNDGPELIQRSG